jgi:hypothetical protein
VDGTASAFAADKKLDYWKGQRLEPGSYLTWGASRRQSMVMGAQLGLFRAAFQLTRLEGGAFFIF